MIACRSVMRQVSVAEVENHLRGTHPNPTKGEQKPLKEVIRAFLEENDVRPLIPLGQMSCICMWEVASNKPGLFKGISEDVTTFNERSGKTLEKGKSDHSSRMIDDTAVGSTSLSYLMRRIPLLRRNVTCKIDWIPNGIDPETSEMGNSECARGSSEWSERWLSSSIMQGTCKPMQSSCKKGLKI